MPDPTPEPAAALASALGALPRLELLGGPTPLWPLERLGAELGLSLWTKRDDLGAVGLGGNKLRKLEFLLAAAVEGGADCVVTAGAAQSNHCRQTAAAAARVGLACHLWLGGEEAATPRGNLLLDRLFGATVHWAGEDRKGGGLVELAERLRGEGLAPAVIPYGGSDPTGATGFVAAALELHRQAPGGFDHIIVATSSGGTQAGLAVGRGALGARGRLHGIVIDPEEPAGGSEAHFAALAAATHAALGLAGAAPSSFELHRELAAPGYGVFSPADRAALHRVATVEGLALDPVYTARAFAGLLALREQGVLGDGERVLFWHTGGWPALFAEDGLLRT